MSRSFRKCHWLGVLRWISVGEGKCVGNQWKLYCECCCFPFLWSHSSCTMCILSPSLMTSRGPGCSSSLYQMRYPNRTAGAAFSVSLSESDIFFLQKCLACWMKLPNKSPRVLFNFCFRVLSTTSSILLSCIVFGSSLLVFLMSVCLGLGSPSILDF